MEAKESLFGKSLSDLQEIVGELRLPGFTAKQITNWLYQKDIDSIDDMSNLSKNARLLLSDKYVFGLTPYTRVFKTAGDQFIETAYIPEENRNTLCVSSQAGCKMRCLFCMTGKQGFQANLTAGEILNQVRSLPEKDSLSNLVFMGMGEPLDNPDAVLKSLEILTAEWGYGWSPKRITVSTIGVIPAMKQFIENSNCHLAVSLHTPFEAERRMLMPVSHVYTAKEIVDTLKSYDFGRQRRVSFEYIIFNGLNDTPKHIKELLRLLDGLKCRINLIRFHPIPNTPLEGTNEVRLQAFKEALNNKGITTTIRASRGQDIDAACGLLSTKEAYGDQTKSLLEK